MAQSSTPRAQRAAPRPVPLSTKTAKLSRLSEVLVPSDGRPLTTLQAMAYLQVSRSTLYRLRRLRKIGGANIGGRYRYYIEDLKRYLTGQGQASA